MKLKLKQPCAVLTLPNGSQVDVERIGKGRFTTAWRNSHNVYLQVHEDDASKELLSRLDDSNPHIPSCIRMPSDDELNTHYRWYRMPLYHPVKAGNQAWLNLKVLKAIQEKCWIETINKHLGAATYVHADVMRRAVYDAMEGAAIPELLKEAVRDIIDASYNYGSYTVEFTKRNTAMDDKGNLVLLDPVFDLEYMRSKWNKQNRNRR